MKINFKKCVSITPSVLALAGAGSVQADPVIAEQILFDSGLSGATKNVNGFSVAIDGEWAFVGAPNNAQNNGQNFCQVYVYKYDYQTNLWGDGGGAVASPGTPVAGMPYTRLRTIASCAVGGFGASVSTSNGLLAVGAPLAKDGGNIRGGKIFFYQYDPTLVTNGTGGWVQDGAVGFPQNPDGTSDIQANAAYGTVVSIRFNPALNRGILLGGAPLYDVGANADAGKVYVYEYIAGATPGTGTVQFINSVEGTQAGAHFGQSVTSNGVHFLVGAPLTTLGPNPNNGAGFLYSFVPALGGAITQLQALIPTTGTDQNTGISVSLSPGSAPGDLTGSVMLLGGNALASQHIYNGLTSPNGPYSTAPGGQVNTLNGDVSQDGDIAGFGFQGDRVELFFDKQNVSGMPGWLFQKTEPEYGRDISVDGGSGLRVMVNGNGNTTTGDGDGVAYAYYTASCYHGGDLKANEWTMIGLQCDVSSAGASGAAANIGDIFTPDLGSYDTNWVMYQQTTNYVGRYAYDADGHGATPNVPYVKMAASDTMVQGQGYWIISDTDKTWTIPTTIGDAATQTAITAWPAGAVQPPSSSVPGGIGIPTRNDLAGIFPYDLAPLLAARTAPVAGDPTGGDDNRMMFSNPFSSAVDWSDTLMLFGNIQSILDDSGLPSIPTAAIAFAEVDPTDSSLGLDNSAYVYDPGTGDYITIAYATPGLAREINPGEGFFVRISKISAVPFFGPVLELAVSK